MRPPSPQVIVAEDQSVNLSCQTTGKPDPVITWFKEGRPITGGRYITLLNGDLLIMVGLRKPCKLYLDLLSLV